MQNELQIATAINLIDLDVSKVEIIEKGKAMAIEQAETGYVDSMESYAKGRQFKEFVDAYLSGMKDYALAALELEDNGKVQKGRVLLETSNSGDKLNYGKDPEYARLALQLKDRAELLKMAKKTEHLVVDPITGEEVMKVPVKTAGGTILKATLK